MYNRRWAIVAALGVVELWIVGLMLRSISGGHVSAHAADGPKTSVASGPQNAPTLGASRSVDTGPAPHVVIDDKNAKLTVSVRPGTTVSVNEETGVHGWVHGSRHPIVVKRTADGVQIVRGDGPLEVFMGFIERRLDVVVPPAARLEVRNAGSTTIAGLRADVAVHSEDGSIVVSDLRGALDARTEDGRIELFDVDAPSLDVVSDNGRIVLDRVRADTIAVTTDDGRIEIGRSLLRGGKIRTGSGRIVLGLDPRSDVTVSARASSGKVLAESPLIATSAGEDDRMPTIVRFGAGSGRLDVGTGDGSISIRAGGV